MILSKSRLIGMSVLLVGLLFTGAGCGKKAATPESRQQAAGQTATEPAQTMSLEDACNHPYYPLKNGYEIAYQVVSPDNTIDMNIVVSGVSAGRAKLDTVINYRGTHTISQDLICGADGSIQTSMYTDMAGAFGSPVKITTKSVSGEVLPKELRAGDKWTIRYDTEMDMSGYKLPNVSKVAGYVETVNEVVGEEQVIVPAGDFTAMKVRSDSVTSYTMAPGAPPQESSSTSYEWYVRGVGLVRTEDVANKSVVSATKIVSP